ncbi:MAG: DEAD/DEAH box helicase family protein [Coriobacteriia bacterium]|nr:DEAD/DEAH box helicase family protein [Coriobacteriia bacterium]
MKFKFKIQPYQTEAAAAVVNVFEGQPNQGAASYVRDLGKSGPSSLFDTAEGYGNASLSLVPAQLLQNLRRIQSYNHIMESAELSTGAGACSLDVEMETGTGKTYVYTKTMFELNRLYGWTKFIIVVPSVAIREGVFKSLQNTEQHFFEQYNKSIKYFIYSSNRLNELDAYSQSSDINAMIINMQAFNTSMKEDGKSKEARIMYSERDEFGSRRPIDVIAANRPVVIQDEPQKMGGKATQEGIKRFNPLFCLNYSATHKVKHDTVYVLDALDAYNQRLVKRIEVKGFELKNLRGTDGYLYLQDIIVSKTKAPVAVIEHKKVNASGKVRKVVGRFDVNDDIYDASGGTKMEAYREGFVIGEIVPDQDGHLGYVRLLNGIVLGKGQVYSDSAEDDIRRIQIRETIQSHLQKEEALFYRGIKCLSLFFIDEVARYRQYDDKGNELTVGYGKVFEEEYECAVAERLARPTTNDLVDNLYISYLKHFGAHDVHRGYFSIDKKGHSVDSAVKRGQEDSDDESAYDLILKNKERLLSFDEPTRFIFSHSALREGWDNPNVFQICTLKHSNSETGKRQEVGRGLRLCVNQDGDRQDLATLGEGEVQKVNALTVIASESYSSFVAALQKDIKAELRDRPQIVTAALFKGRAYTMDDGQTIAFASGEETIAYAFLLKNDFIDLEGVPTEKFKVEGISYAIIQLPEVLQAKAPAIEALVKSVYDSHALDNMVSNGLETKVTENGLNENFHKKEFQELWKRINSKHAYTVSFDDGELRRKAISHINEHLVVSKLSYALTVGSQRSEATREDLAVGEQFRTQITTTKEIEVSPASNVTYDLIGEVAQAAVVTRRSAAAILSEINAEKFACFKENPEEFIAKVSKAIIAEKATMIVDHITYRTLNDHYDSEIFTERMPENITKAILTKRCIQNYVFTDSGHEREFTEALETASEVCVYAKLPRSFQIPTPVGNYAPDWAIAFNEGTVKHIYFVAETKGTMDTLELRGVEHAKIACAKKLFNEMSTTNVRYSNVDSYEQLLNVIGSMG